MKMLTYHGIKEQLSHFLIFDYNSAIFVAGRLIFNRMYHSINIRPCIKCTMDEVEDGNLNS